ncbi:MAG: hypothetical protein IVW57_17095, partial [Ktedonobacterales bacterium]|nr:hypothetical protein [Ktedonobacterales bacterium]
LERVATPDLTGEIGTESGLMGNDLGMPQYPAIDHAAIEAQMNQETGHAHTPHKHPYADGMVHENDHYHDHSDGTAAHRHLHSHSGTGDGVTPHVHLNEHGHQYSRAASDMERTAAGDYVARSDAFIGQDDPRLAVYLPATPRAPQTVDLPPANARPAPQRVAEPAVTRVGARISGDTASGLHAATDQLLRTCGCERCQMLLSIIDPDQDGDDDSDPALDTDAGSSPDLLGGRVQQARVQRRMRRVVETEITRRLDPVTQQLRQIAARLAGVQTPDLRRVDDQLATLTSQMGTVAAQVERIAHEQKRGGPVLRADALTTRGGAPQDTAAFTEGDVRALEKAAHRGLIPSLDQVRAAAALITQQNGLR